MEAMTDFIFLGSKITANIDCLKSMKFMKFKDEFIMKIHHEIQRCLLLGEKKL